MKNIANLFSGLKTRRYKRTIVAELEREAHSPDDLWRVCNMILTFTHLQREVCENKELLIACMSKMMAANMEIQRSATSEGRTYWTEITKGCAIAIKKMLNL